MLLKTSGRTWSDYEAQYLKESIENGLGKYGASTNDRTEDSIYLNKISEDYKKEADASLKNEFSAWLQGGHEDNVSMPTYVNVPGKAERLHVYRSSSGDVTGEAKSEWRPTWWGRKQLTHLPGVREYLRKEEKQKVQQSLEISLFDEHGPQDIDTAWKYLSTG